MTTLLVVPDGAEGVLGGAATPALASLPLRATIHTVPAGWPVTSEVALPALLDLHLDRPSARGPIEAASLGIALDAHAAAWRLDLTRAEPGADADEVADDLSRAFTSPVHHLRRGRFLLVGPVGWLRHGPGDRRRRAAEQAVGAAVRVWGGGAVTELPQVDRSTAVVCAPTGAAAGIARLVGADVVSPAGATGFPGSDLMAKAGAARALLDAGAHRRVVVHVGAIDEAGHAGDRALQIDCARTLDDDLIAPLAHDVAERSCSMVVAPDHVTDARSRSHLPGPVQAYATAPAQLGLRRAAWRHVEPDARSGARATARTSRRQGR